MFTVPVADNVEIEDGDPDDLEEDEEERPCPLARLGVPFDGDEGVDEDELLNRATVTEITVRMLDWMGEHKTTWVSAEGAWEMMRSILPENTALCAFSRVKAILVAHLDGRLLKIDICPCNYTVYMNCSSAAYQCRKTIDSVRTV